MRKGKREDVQCLRILFFLRIFVLLGNLLEVRLLNLSAINEGGNFNETGMIAETFFFSSNSYES